MKTTLRDAAILVAAAVFGTLAVIVWRHFSATSAQQRALASLMAQPSPQHPITPPVLNVSPNRQVPAHDSILQLPEIPAAPTDDQIVGSRVFADRLWPIDGLPGAAGAAADNAALGEFLRRMTGLSEKEKFAALEDWLKTHGQSRWALALTHEFMGYKYKTGWFDMARQGWDGIWQKVKDRTDLPGYHLGNDVLGRLLDANIGISRTAKLRELVAAADARPLNGALEGKVFRAREAVWLLEHTAAQNVMCGPLALNAIKQYLREPFIAPRLSQVPPEFQQTGIPMSEVQRYARNDYRLDLAMVKRSDNGTKIPTPAVMHVKDDHFNALLAASEDGSQYFLEDRTLNFAGWVDKAAVDQAASGYFLVAANSVGADWQPVDFATGNTVFGRDGAHGTTPTDESTGDEDPKTDKDPCAKGMPRYTFHPMPGAIRIGDIPLSYMPPVGPKVDFQINYNDMDSGAPTSPPTWSHVGVTWSTNWVAWVEHVSGGLTNGTALRVRVPGGGTQVVRYSSATARFGPHDQSFATVTRTGTYTYTRELPDGTREVYNAPNHPTTPTRVFLSQLIDPQGNAISFAYDANVRLVSVTDTIGQVTTLAYTDAGNIYRITQVTDPFGRFCSLAYDVSGRLTSVTDQIGLATTFAYNANGFIGSMTTPYGTSQFSKVVDVVGANRIVEAIDPLGGTERVEFNDTGSTFVPSVQAPPTSVQVGGQNVPFYVENTRLQFRNGWYWDKLASEAAPGDYKAARNYRFFTDVNWQVVPVLEAIKPALEDRIWFNYPGGVLVDGSGFPYYVGASAAPEKILRMLPDGTPQLRQITSNALGNLVKTVDPLGRTTEYTYAANGVDLLQVRQTTGGVSEVQAAFTYNAQHLPDTFTDASGNVTSYTYNARGQMETVTNPLGEVTTFEYNANSFLTAMNGPLPGDSDKTLYTYDSAGRLLTLTSPDGFTRTFSYDNFDRVTRIDYPDGTFETSTFDKLDRVAGRDRLGRVTTYAHDALQRTISTTDPLNRVVTMQWCRCDGLNSLTDPLGRTTRWQRDVQGRVTAKVYADGSKVSFTYDGSVGRLIRRTDEKGQNKLFDYYPDDMLKQNTYPNALRPTPPVSYRYDLKYPRVLEMTDGIGTTVYAYNSVAPGTAGAGKVSTVDGPLPDDTIAFVYDALGRTQSYTINGVGETLTRDVLGRITGQTNPLGAFSIGYAGATERPALLTYPGGATAAYDYYGATGDFRLKDLVHTAPGAGEVSRHSYQYDAMGNITRWTQVMAAGSVNRSWVIGYDNADQLTAVTAKDPTTSADLAKGHYQFGYDAAGNRTTETIDGVSTLGTYNALNQLLSQSNPGAGPLQTAQTYEWDAEERLVAINYTGSKRRTEIQYDGTGLRRAIIEKDNTTILESRRYVWLGMQLAEEREADGRTVRKRYFSGGMQVASNGTLEGRLFARDHLGSVRQILSATGVAATMDFDPWGRRTVAAGGTDDASLGLTGHWQHTRSGLALAPFRAYAPSQARWLSRDPISENGGINLYMYANNNPVNEIDPLGLYVGVDDAAFALGGALFGLAGQVVGDVWNGQMSGWEDYAGSILGGAVGGEALLYTGPVGAGLAGGAAGNLIKQGLKNLTGKQCGFDAGSFAFDSAVGAATGLLPGYKAAGWTTGRGNYNSIYKQMVTKAQNGTISSMRPQTAAKMFLGRAADTGVPSGTAVATASSIIGPNSQANCPCNEKK